MARAAMVEVAPLSDRAARVAASRSMPAQAGRALVPLPRHRNESAAPRARVMKVREAYDFCRRLTHKHGANFSVGFRFLPRKKRDAVYAAYAFCRWADDIVDESPEGSALIAND